VSEIQEVMGAVKEVYQFMADDDELWAAMARMCRKFYSALILEGFSHSEAMVIVEGMSANMNSTKQT
jgi:molybdopterin-guanine dinucleotide biosynthesis protein